MINIIRSSLIDLPSPRGLSYLWNYGSLLGVFLIIQIISGLFLAFHFENNMNLSFDRVIHLIRDVSYGWILRVIHANGASIFFILIYIHIGRGFYYGSYRYKNTWLRGVTILLLSIGAAFLGYVLPWGQMSFWAATVITNLLSAIPYIGKMIVEWIWGGFAVRNPTLVRFFAFHFIFPFIILFLVILHLFFLHETGSGNPIGLGINSDKVIFHPYFSVKDIYGLFLFLIFYIFICFSFPYIFMDVENFISSDPLVTPIHIQPEWYFLFAYAILRSVPSKVGGVIALIMSVILLYLLPFCYIHRFRSNFLYTYIKFLYWIFVINWLLLTWIGACIVEIPYRVLGIYFRLFYFIIYIILYIYCEFQDLLIIWLYYYCFESSL